jgi:uncharacterized protein YjeT (DUF2065 family)
MEFYFKYKTIILRALGTILLVGGLIVMFWETPKKGISEDEKAAQRVARMEAAAMGKNMPNNINKEDEKPKSIFMSKMKETQEKQLRYMLILSIVFGIGFLGYSFIKNDETK